MENAAVENLRILRLVIPTLVKSMVGTLSGPNGLIVQQNVVVEPKSEPEHAPTLRLKMVVCHVSSLENLKK